MPYKKYTTKKRKYKKRMTYAKKVEKTSATKRERGDKTAQNQLIERSTPFLKSSHLLKNQMYYDSGIQLLPTVSAPQTFYKANCAFDPYDPAGGHQPMGFDQMMLFYEHFGVIRSNISVTFSNTSDTESYRVGIILSPDTSTLSITQLLENGQCKTAILGPATGSQNVKTISLDCDVKNYFGKRTYRDIIDDDRLVGDISNSPVERVHYGIFAISSFGTPTNEPVNCDVILAIDTIYFEPKKVASS